MLSLSHGCWFFLRCKRCGCEVLCSRLNRAKVCQLKAAVTPCCCTTLRPGPIVNDSMRASSSNVGRTQAPACSQQAVNNLQSVLAWMSVPPSALQATVCAKFGLECIVYMGAKDMERQKLNVFRMRLLGAEVRPVHSGTATLKDATSEAIRDWVTNVETTHYILGSAAGPHPYPMMVSFHVPQ